MTPVTYRGYRDPRDVPPAFMAVVMVSIAVSAVLFLFGSLFGFVTALPMLAYVVVIARQAKRLRNTALADLDAVAPHLSQEEVEQRLEAILKVYGGGPLPSVRRQAHRIREQASTFAPSA